MATEISREFKFCAAHRIEGHPKCSRLHGHNYRVVVDIRQESFVPRESNQGMLLDYGVIDTVVKPLIDAMDHRYLVSESNVEAGDPYAQVALQNGDIYLISMYASTAECLSEFLYGAIATGLVGAGFSLVHWVLTIQVDETDRSTAVYTEY